MVSKCWLQLSFALLVNILNSWQILCVYEPIPFGELVITSRDRFRPVFGGFRAIEDSVFHLYFRTRQTYLWQSCLLFTFWMGGTSVGSRFETIYIVSKSSKRYKQTLRNDHDRETVIYVHMLSEFEISPLVMEKTSKQTHKSNHKIILYTSV